MNVMVVHHVLSSTCRMIGAWLANRKVPLLLALLVYFIHPSSSFWSENTVSSFKQRTHTEWTRTVRTIQVFFYLSCGFSLQSKQHCCYMTTDDVPSSAVRSPAQFCS